MLNRIEIVLLFFNLLALTSAQRWRHQNRGVDHNFCRTPLGDAGQCVSLLHCSEVVRLFERLPVQQAKEYSSQLQNICGRRVTSDNYPVLCCTHVNTAVGGQLTTPRIEAAVTISTPSTTSTEILITSTTTGATIINNTSTIDEAIYRLTEAFRCNGPRQESGVCKPLQNCTQLYEALVNDQSNLTLQDYLRESHKSCNATRALVCCPTETVVGGGLVQSLSERGPATTLLPSEEDGCGLVTYRMQRVVGGRDSQPGAWPWAALLGYNRNSAQPFKCGGTLVSVRHVISAAHCVRSDLSFVRLGEHDLSDNADNNHIDVDLVQVKQHPSFASRDNVGNRYDVAVLHLVSTVSFTDRIQPICMPNSPDLRRRRYVGYKPFVVGWGKTLEGGNSSNILQQIQISILDNNVCIARYSTLGRLRSVDQFDASVICAGVLEGGRDACQGDSGGPLMIPELYKGIVRYYLIGVVSYGVGCGRPDVPGVYTSTQYFMDWILQMIAEPMTS